MAGTLTVQNLQGPTSGANANKIIVPAGHELYAAGHVVQQVEFSTKTTFSTSSTTFTKTNMELSITPKYANSKINIIVFASGYSAATGGARGQLWKNGSAITGFNEEDLIAYTNVVSALSDMSTIFYTDTNVGTTNPITYGYYIRSYTGNSVSFYRNQSITLQEIAQ